MNTYNELKMLYGAYLGVSSMDNYKTKEYVVKNIEDEINKFIDKNNMYYHDEVLAEAKKQSLITDLQDSLIILKRLNESLELSLLIKEKIRYLKEEEK
nr:hypothetical protein [Bacilli bacterium]